ncbi:MAG: M28 family peptidase [Bacteroidales bacterium]|nr:M28 family peptidase [Bacteroidales bacterium]
MNLRSFSVIVGLCFACNLIHSQETANAESDFLINTRQLIFEGNRSGEGYFSEDGRYLIFQSEREKDNPFFQIYILDFESGDIQRVSPGTGKTTCAYFQWKGDRVSYASSHLDPRAVIKQKEELDFRASGKERRYAWDYEPEMDIFSSLRDGTDILRLTDTYGYDAEGSCSPDGKYIVFSSNREAYERDLTGDEKKILEVDLSFFCDLYIMNADGSGLRRLTRAPGYDGGPFFSADGEKIIWRRFDESGHKADVYVMNTDGTDEKQITDFGCLSWAPFFHPSGDYIIFAANKQGYSNFELYIVDAEGSKEPVRVTFTEKFDGLPVFSPDGKKLVWTSSRTPDGASQLFIAGWNDDFARQQLASASFRSGYDKTGFSPQISLQEMKEKLTYIASDDLEGRLTGSEGIKQAAGYITGIFTSLGLETAGEKDSYLHPFDFVAEVRIDSMLNTFALEGEHLKAGTDFFPLASSESGEAEGQIVFAGYGLKISDGGNYNYDSYASLDVEGKIVIVLNGIPGGLDEEKQKLFERSIASGYKQMLARRNGAKAILMVTPEISERRTHEVVGSSGLISLAVSEPAADRLLKSNNETIQSLTEKLAGGNQKGNERLFEINRKVHIKTDIQRIKKQDDNIAAVVSSDDPEAGYIFIGAHYDHLGMGEVNSRDTGDDRNKVHNGADDNGSGTVAVIELAEYFAGMKKENPDQITSNLVFCLWSGEELGLLGSNAFASDLPVAKEKVKAYINFDMVGRMKDNKLDMQGIGSAQEWKSILEAKNVVSGFDLNIIDDPFLPTDATSFYIREIPVLSFFTGVHNDYHTHRDDVEFINFDDMQRVVKFASLVIKELMKPGQSLAYQKVAMKPQGAGKSSASVSLGTIPAYAGSDEPGVQIQGVRPGGPAEKAGLQQDDIITGLDGKEINNIYDFMNILGELKADVETEIIVKRGGEKLSLKIVPETKK